MTGWADPRFEPLGDLGRGAATVVLRVRDRVYGVERALKLATERGQLRRFKSEYFRLCELRHPGIVAAHDFGITSGGLPYYTMELVPGAPLGAGSTHGDPEVLALVALQALEALAVLHARGLVHRDLKPRNLLVDRQGPATLVRLIDLGLAVPVGSRSGAAGTLPYMAPEVARGEAVDGRADLYSLGAVLYEALLPDEAARTLDEVARRMLAAPPAPSRLNPLIPASFSAFVMRLLEPDREARFSDADQAAEVLAEVADLDLRRGPPRARAERLLQAGAVSHRQGVVASLRKAAQLVRAGGKGGVWCIEAPVGVGKTPLVRELSMALNLAGLRVLGWAASGDPASPLDAMSRAAAVLAPDSGGEPTAWRDPGTAGGGVSELLGQLGPRLARAVGGSPTAVLLDDLQRAEPIVIEVLASFARAARELPLLVVAASEPREGLPTVASLLGGEATLLRLDPLGDIEVARLAAHRLHGLQLPAPALERLVQDSQGMPSLVERTLARLVVDRTVQRHGGEWVFVGGRYRPARHADGRLVAQRTAEVDPAARRVLAAVAVLGARLEPARVAAVAELPVETAAAAMEILARLEILDPPDTGAAAYEFGSRSTRSAVYQTVPAAERKGMHDRAAALLARERGAGPRGDEEVEHLLRGGDDALAVELAVEAAEHASAMYADRRAIEFFLRAHARIGNEPSTRAATIALRLGKLYERTGELEHASAWYAEAASGFGGEPAVAIHASLGLSEVSLLRGLINDAEQHAARAVELARTLEAPDPGLLAVAERTQARVAAERGDSDRAEGLLREALVSFENGGAEGAAVGVLLELARLARSRGELVLAVRHARRALQRARKLGDAATVAEASAVLGRGLVRGGRHLTARRVLRGGLRVARASGDRLREAQLLRQLGNVELRLGDLDRAVELLTRALELARANRARTEEVSCLRGIGMVRSRFGELRPALIALHAAHEAAQAAGDPYGTATSALALGETYASVGHLAAARAFVDRAGAVGTPLLDPALDAEMRAVGAWVALAAGEAAPARDVSAYVLDRIVSVEDPGERAIALLFAARATLRLGWPQTARRVGERLAEEIELSGRRDLIAVSQGLLGQVAFAVGENEEAEGLLGLGAALAAQSNLRPLEIELRSALGRLHAGTTRGAQELTRAMELTREVATALPADLVDGYLGRPDAQELRAAFGRERSRLLGA